MPEDMSDAEAQELLESAIPEPSPFELPGEPPRDHPKRLYAVYQGVIYEADVTQWGKSYHGYPWTQRPGRSPLPYEVIEQLRARARRDGFEKQFEEWYSENGP